MVSFAPIFAAAKSTSPEFVPVQLPVVDPARTKELSFADDAAAVKMSSAVDPAYNNKNNKKNEWERSIHYEYHLGNRSDCLLPTFLLLFVFHHGVYIHMHAALIITRREAIQFSIIQLLYITESSAMHVFFCLERARKRSEPYLTYFVLYIHI